MWVRGRAVNAVALLQWFCGFKSWLWPAGDLKKGEPASRKCCTKPVRMYYKKSTHFTVSRTEGIVVAMSNYRHNSEFEIGFTGGHVVWSPNCSNAEAWAMQRKVRWPMHGCVCYVLCYESVDVNSWVIIEIQLPSLTAQQVETALHQI